MKCFSIGHAFKCVILVCTSVRTRTVYLNPSQLHVYLTNGPIKTTRDLFSYSRDLWLLLGIIFFLFFSQRPLQLGMGEFLLHVFLYSFTHEDTADELTKTFLLSAATSILYRVTCINGNPFAVLHTEQIFVLQIGSFTS